ncbi:MAG: alanine:cation symporter family protein, partial [Lachnospiraceae bacterium]|nr:alanine:cation symporter family protein [Lachnospiraceae bacterium]
KKGCRYIGAGLAGLFSVFCLLASFGIGNMSQVNSMTANVVTAGSQVGITIPEIAVGIFLFIAVGAAVLGGLKRIAAIAEKLVPFMLLLYFIGTLITKTSHT